MNFHFAITKTRTVLTLFSTASTPCQCACERCALIEAAGSISVFKGYTEGALRRLRSTFHSMSRDCIGMRVSGRL